MDVRLSFPRLHLDDEAVFNAQQNQTEDCCCCKDAFDENVQPSTFGPDDSQREVEDDGNGQVRGDHGWSLIEVSKGNCTRLGKKVNVVCCVPS